MKCPKFFCVGGFLWACLGPAQIAQAHDPGLSTATFTLGADKLKVALGFSATDAAAIVNASQPSGQLIQKAEPTQLAARLRELAPRAFEIKFDGAPVTPTSAQASFDDANNVTVRLDFEHPPFSKLSVRSLWFGSLPLGHREIFSLQKPGGETLAERLLSAHSDSLSVEIGDTAAGESSPPKNSFLDFLAMGVKHIWTGYDHLLFLFGLMIVTRNFKSSVKIITCFTIAHSITLAVATLNLVEISSRVVEPLIAASIVYVGLENIFSRGEPKGRWVLTFAFGLIHGFGFATVLRELGVGANGSSLAVPLISFNLGVELGQIAVAALVLPLIWKWRTRPGFAHRWVPAASTALTLLGGFWFVQRVWF